MIPRVILYPRTGHYIDPPCTPFERASFHRLAQSVVVWGGDPIFHQQAQIDCWAQVLKFFRCALLTSPPHHHHHYGKL